METLTAIKNRYWLLILPALLFLTSYYSMFILRLPAAENAGQERHITFSSFLIYNYLLHVVLMFLFLFFNFLLLKGITYMWQDLNSKKVFKAISISYLVFFIPSIISSLYFTLFDTDFHPSEVNEFGRAFYLRTANGIGEQQLESNVMNSFLSSVNLMEFAYFAVMIVVLQLLFEELPMKKIVPMVLILACVHFASKTILPLMFN